jgi:hypothetical protein
VSCHDRESVEDGSDETAGAVADDGLREMENEQALGAEVGVFAGVFLEALQLPNAGFRERRFRYVPASAVRFEAKVASWEIEIHTVAPDLMLCLVRFCLLVESLANELLKTGFPP